MSSYHTETDSLAHTQFKLFCESPTEYHETFVTGRMSPKKQTSEMLLGIVEHAMLLEKKKLDDIVREYPTSCLNANGGLVGKPAEAFRQKIHPIIAMKADEIETAKVIYANVMKSELGQILKMDVAFEQRIDAEVDGVKCRCKPDIHSPGLDQVRIWDMKFTERIKPDDWWRTARSFGYATQDAFYSLVAERKWKLPVSFMFWAIETVYPHRVKPYWYDERSRELAREFVVNKLEVFKQCQASGDWSDKWESTGEVSPWDLDADRDGEIVEWTEADS